MNKLSIEILADKVFRLMILSKAATDYETRNFASFPVVGFDGAESMVFILSDALEAIRTTAHAQNLDTPDAELSSACAISAAAVRAALETETGGMTKEDFFSLLYPVVHTMEQLFEAFDRLTEEGQK